MRKDDIFPVLVVLVVAAVCVGLVMKMDPLLYGDMYDDGAVLTPDDLFGVDSAGFYWPIPRALLDVPVGIEGPSENLPEGPDPAAGKR